MKKFKSYDKEIEFVNVELKKEYFISGKIYEKGNNKIEKKEYERIKKYFN